MRSYLRPYSAAPRPEHVTVPATNYVVIDRHVLAESADAFRTAVTLDVLSTAIHARLREQSGLQYLVFPLEGVWHLLDSDVGFSRPENIQGRMMTKQPFELSSESLSHVKAECIKNSEGRELVDYLAAATLEPVESHEVVQMLHVGPYSDEPSTFATMNEFARVNGLNRRADAHREVYLKDVRHGPPDAFETILRVSV